MGRKIAQRKYTKGKTRRRIWNSEDALKVLRENIDTDRVRSLILDKQLLSITPTTEENSGIEGFTKLSSLKLLYLNKWLWRRASFSNAKLNGGGYKNFPTSLIWLSWHGFPLKFIPNAFTLEELVVLDLRKSSLEYIWKGPKFLPNLKILNLSHSHLLVAFPDCSKLPNLELLILKDCINLVEIDKSIGFLEKKLPREIARMRSLEELLLSGCSELNEIPEELVELDSLRVFDASGTAINQGSSISERSPRFSLAILPHFLTVLRLKDCNLSDDVIPGDISLLCSLVMLKLSGNPIQTLPQSIVSLAWLEFLSLDRCRRLQFLPELPQGLRGLNLVGCKSLEKLRGELWTKKEHVGINGCANLSEIEGLYKLQKMTDIDKIIMDVFHIFSLKALANSFEVEMINCRTQSMLTEKFQLLKFSMPRVQRNQRLTGLNLCVVYAFDSSKIDSFHPFVKDKIDGSFSFVAIITNITKGIRWFYRPAFFAKPETGVNMTWLSHWKFGDQLQGGDEVEVRVIGSFAVGVKKVGIDRVFEEGIQIPTHYVDTSPYEVRPGCLQPVEFRFDHSRRGPVGPRPFDYRTNRSP
ncbi:hypothetical protein P3X46_031995 [Hevea brasiliensis]|uniref:Uncharacterized protein n=1 Tax=Hevea brasiliensis TaxID=3981 RepID=A0ABQ9KM38_HEVBR|nr:hypothetical protein P3X46_031995 [Hevea brasiliensis]